MVEKEVNLGNAQKIKNTNSVTLLSVNSQQSHLKRHPSELNPRQAGPTHPRPGQGAGAAALQAEHRATSPQSPPSA